MKSRYRIICLALCGLNVADAFGARDERESAAVRAERLFRKHCETAGEKIKRTVEDVDGFLVMKLRSNEVNYGDQYKLDDPYGSDLLGEGYLHSFLREFYDVIFVDPSFSPLPTRSSLPAGYRFVEAVNSKDGVRYRYTGHIEEPWLKNKRYLKGYFRFVMEARPTEGKRPRYGLTYDDISSNQDRSLWIAGSSLRVIDLETGEVIAERIGYMFDPAQGSNAGGRSPWLMAARYACPSFGNHHAANFQSKQAERFVEKVLHPIRDK